MTQDFIDNFDIADKSNWTAIESMIKVIGVGGGGCNAVNYMYKEKVEGCSFIVCNTDQQALDQSPVPVKIHIGKGKLGAGTDPAKGRNAAIEAQDKIEQIALDSNTRMLFITAGMGGGTGTGAAPVIAKMAKDKGILTVAVVTIPFENEGDAALTRAVDGIHELVKNVDSLLIINNQKLYDYFGDQLIHKAFPQSDEVLATAVKGITEIISRPGYINVDFEDVRTMMKDSGMALMGSGIGSGKNRLDDAVQGALKSPLLNDFDLKTAKNLLINITAGQNDKGLLMQDLKAINDKIAEYTGSTKKFKTGIVWDDDPDFGDNVRITAIATGFKVNDLKKIANADLGNIIEIDRNFKYDKSQNLTTGSIIDDDTNNVTVIGYNPDGNVKRFHIDADRKPVLIKNPGEDISELENIPAIKRKEHNKKKD